MLVIMGLRVNKLLCDQKRIPIRTHAIDLDFSVLRMVLGERLEHRIGRIECFSRYLCRCVLSIPMLGRLRNVRIMHSKKFHPFPSPAPEGAIFIDFAALPFADGATLLLE